MDEHVFDLDERLAELRNHPTSWLRTRREELVREQRRLRVEELAVTRVLDERDALGTMPDGQVSARTSRAEVEVSRALESLPAIAAAAHAGALSWDQLRPLVEVATSESDTEWAARAPRCAPIDLERLARRRRKVSLDEALARRAAREFRWWWRRDAGMLSVRGEIPDVDGVRVKSVFERMTERMRPPKGQAWDTMAHRGADALVDLCRTYADVEPTGRAKAHIMIHTPLGGPPEADGIALADETVVALRPALVRDTVVDGHGAHVATSRARAAIPRDVERHVRWRDHHCRVPGCEETRRLQLHHLDPRSRGGGNEPANLAAVCPSHHRLLVPNGPYRLTGDPNQPDGLVLVHRDELLADARAGPAA